MMDATGVTHASRNTVRRRELRQKHKDRLQQMAFLIELQIRGIRRSLDDICERVVWKEPLSKEIMLQYRPLRFIPSEGASASKPPNASGPVENPTWVETSLGQIPYGLPGGDMRTSSGSQYEWSSCNGAEFTQQRNNISSDGVWNECGSAQVAGQLGSIEPSPPIEATQCVTRNTSPSDNEPTSLSSLEENCVAAQAQAAHFREAEMLGERMTSEAESIAKSSVRFNPNCELPAVLDVVSIGDFVLAHVDFALQEHRPEHRRPYLQQQYARIEARTTIDETLGELLTTILDKYAPAQPLENFQYACSHCMGGYAEADNECVVCGGYDIFNVRDFLSEHRDDCETDDGFIYIGNLAAHSGRAFDMRCDHCRQSMDPGGDAWLCTRCDSFITHSTSFGPCKKESIEEHLEECHTLCPNIYTKEKLEAEEKRQRTVQRTIQA